MNRHTRVLSRSDLAPLAEDAGKLSGLLAAIEQSMLDVDAGGPQAEVSFSGVTTDAGMLQAYVTALVPGGASLRIFPGPGSRFATATGMLFDGDGHLRALIALDDLNALRTSVPVAVGVRHLAPPNTRVVTVLGSGAQARSHAAAVIPQLSGLDEFRVWSPTTMNRRRFAAEVGSWLGVTTVACDDADEAVRGADVVMFAGSPPAAGTTPFSPNSLAPGTLVTDITFAMAPLFGQCRLVVPTRTRGIPMAIGFPGGWGPPFEVGKDPLAILEPLPLTAVIRAEASARFTPDDQVVFEIGGTYLWDQAIFAWLEGWAAETGRGVLVSLA